LLSHQRKKEKKVWRQVCEWLSEAAAHLPASVSLLLLEALFMQISGVSLTLTWSLRLCLLRVLHGAMPLLQAFSFPSTLGEVTLRQLSQACVFIYNSHWKWVFPPLLWSFLPPPILQAFLLLIAGHVPLLLPSPAGLLEGISPPLLQCSVCPTLFAMCLFCCYCLLFSFFLFFPWVGVRRLC
jgi:hypothetical protein